ncbi:MAG: hypothetical protein ACT4OM_13140 [Actinomycetota bacterium]
MRVGLSNFLRFISASGISKVNEVTESLQEYQPYMDYYKPFREATILGLAERNIERLEKLVASIELKKVEHYTACLAGLKRWIEKHDFKVTSHPQGEIWEAGEIHVTVNPEFVMDVDGVCYIVKLYMSQKSLTRSARRAFAWLVMQTHGTEAIPALLELRKGKLTPCPFPPKRLGQWVKGEAAAFEAIWKMNRAA